VSAEASAGRSVAALGVGALAGAIVTVPALVRLLGAGIGAGSAALVLAGGSALVLGPLLVLVDRTRGGDARPSSVLAALGLAAWPLARFGSLLEQTTHHRPLGAATFALVALALVLGSLLVAHRVSVLAASGSALGRGLTFAIYAAAAGSLALVLGAVLRADGARPHVLDGMFLVVGGALGWVALRLPAVVHALSRSGAPLWIALVAAHLFGVTRPSFEQIRDHAPVLSGPAGWI
jgi:hypothetical protein